MKATTRVFNRFMLCAGRKRGGRVCARPVHCFVPALSRIPAALRFLPFGYSPGAPRSETQIEEQNFAVERLRSHQRKNESEETNRLFNTPGQLDSLVAGCHSAISRVFIRWKLPDLFDRWNKSAVTLSASRSPVFEKNIHGSSLEINRRFRHLRQEHVCQVICGIQVARRETTGARPPIRAPFPSNGSRVKY